MDLSAPPVPSVSESTVVNDAYVPAVQDETTNSLRNRLRKLLHDKKDTDKSHKLLGEWRATAIAGNDISSSCLYTAGICAQKGNLYKILHFK